jgi:hypothetical protein
MKLYQRHDASEAPIELVPCTAGVEYKIGMGLTVAAGGSAKVAATTVPDYICVADKTGVAGESVQAVRVGAAETYIAKLSAAGTSLKEGDKVTIDTDGIRVTATTTSGVAKIVGFTTATKAAGDSVLIRF